MATHGLSAADYQRWVEGVTARGYRIALVSVSSGDAPRFAAVAVEDGDRTGWLARAGLSADDFQRLFDEQAKKGFRLVSLSGYLDGKVSRYAAVWIQDRRAGGWTARHGLTEGEFAREISAQKARGLRPDSISAFTDAAGVPRFAAVFVAAGKTPWIARHGLSGGDYQKVFDEWVPRGYRAVTTTACVTADGPRFAVAFVKDERGWSAQHDLSAADYQKAFDRQGKKGFRPLSIAAYAAGVPAGIDTFDEAMRGFMKERSIPTGTITVSRHGAILFSKGYGFADRARTRRIRPEDPFRIASLTKPITAAAVRNLVARGKLTLDTRAFAFLGTTPPPGKKPDPRLAAVTVRHLLEHKGGWDRARSSDPMFEPLKIARALGKAGPASAHDVVRYMMGQPLDFAPGSKSAYSNFGYCVLGRVIEKATGQAYTAHVQKELLAPIQIHGVELGRSLPALRNRREPFYADPSRGDNVVEPASKRPVPAPDGTFFLEAMDSHGGLIASSVDLTRFLDAYWISGTRRSGGSGSVAAPRQSAGDVHPHAPALLGAQRRGAVQPADRPLEEELRRHRRGDERRVQAHEQRRPSLCRHLGQGVTGLENLTVTGLHSPAGMRTGVAEGEFDAQHSPGAYPPNAGRFDAAPREFRRPLGPVSRAATGDGRPGPGRRRPVPRRGADSPRARRQHQALRRDHPRRADRGEQAPAHPRGRQLHRLFDALAPRIEPATGAAVVSVDPGLRHRVFDRPGEVLRRFNAPFLPARLVQKSGFFSEKIPDGFYYDYEHYSPPCRAPRSMRSLAPGRCSTAATWARSPSTSSSSTATTPRRRS